ncbi:MAG TPA: outer membrane protein assembly factor BamE [Steroidobacteraceae bacterium]|jgi:outer membrane protein assembly factor BamE (lipoprotein component of BamABCDE complex)|nr:outer membrane protein assembly factor BamE [Steroidobacteraceae bacterium]
MHKTSSCAPIILSAGLLAAWPAIAGAPKGDAAQNAAVAARVIDANVLAQVVPGISKADVKKLLGEPWRTVQYNDLEEVENEFWEYRGKEPQGTYRVHIEFDKQGKVVIVGKIPDAAGGKGTPAKS